MLVGEPKIHRLCLERLFFVFAPELRGYPNCIMSAFQVNTGKKATPLDELDSIFERVHFEVIFFLCFVQML